jgi:ABC-type transport system involved in multi-copper enzyme maturation permease subunit
MSTTTATPVAPLDLSGTPGIGFGRLLLVELRKLVDTRASRWLLIAIAAVTTAIVVIFFLASDEQDRTFSNLTGATGILQSYLLPVLPIMLVTGEWSQRTALTTFTLVPGRGRVVLAKVVASVLAGLAAVVLAFALAALGAAVGGAPDAFASFGFDWFGRFTLLETMGILEGLGFALLFLNSAAAIVVYLVVPIAFSIIANVWTFLRDAAPWIDLGTAQTPLQDPAANVDGHDWLHLLTATLIWIVLPFVIGLVRVLRAEVK